MPYATSLLTLALVIGARSPAPRAPQDVAVDGLRAGERFELLPPAPYDPGPALEGRVVDATTGRPVPDVVLESWTEENDAHALGFLRVGVATTGRDGRFALAFETGGILAEKVRARAPGYLAWSGSRADLFEPVRLFRTPATAPRLVVTDLDGAPIVGARITTTYSCAHDVPAFERTTGVFGEVTMPEHGWQEHPVELRVRAPGYGAVEYVSEHEVLALEDQPAVVRLARRRPFGARLLERDGEVLALAPLEVIDGEGHHVARTDAEGRFVIATPYERREPLIRRLDESDRLVYVGPLPEDREVTLRIGGDELPEDVARAVVRVRCNAGDGDGETDEEGKSGRALILALFHQDGWTPVLRREQPGLYTAACPAGRALLVAGGAFTGWQEQVRELQLAPETATEVELEPVRERRLTILLPEGSTRLVVQAGEHSVEPAPEEVVFVDAPRDRPLVVLCEGRAPRRLRVAAGEGDVRVDLEADGERLPVSSYFAMLDRPRTRLVAECRDAEGVELPCELGAYGSGEPQVERLGPARFAVEAHAGAPLVLTATSEGCAATSVHAVAPTESGEGTPLVLSPTRLAALAIEGPARVVGPLAEELDALAPGPLELVLALDDGRRLALALELAPGERRHLRVE